MPAKGENHMRRVWLLGAMSLVVGLGGCMIVEAPIRGVVGTEVTWGDMATGEAELPHPRCREGGQGLRGVHPGPDGSRRRGRARGEGERRDHRGDQHRALGQELLWHRRRVVHDRERVLGKLCTCDPGDSVGRRAPREAPSLHGSAAIDHRSWILRRARPALDFRSGASPPSPVGRDLVLEPARSPIGHRTELACAGTSRWRTA